MCDSLDRAKKYKSPKHSSSMMNIMYTLYRRKKICDVELVVGDKKFLAHGIVLAACSPYLNSKFEERTDPIKEIFLEGINEMITLKMIEFCYTGVIEMRTRSVADILTAASLFQIDALVESCCKFMSTTLSVSNCFQFFEAGQLHGCEELKNSADEFMSENFKQVSKSEQFLKIEGGQLISLLKKNLSISNEYDVLKAVKIWFNHDPENRKKFMTSLLKIIRLPLIPSQVINDEVNPMCRDIADCQSLIIQALVFKQNPNTETNSDVYWNIPRTSNNTIMVLGSVFKENAGIMDIYDPKENRWRKYLDTQIYRRTSNVVIIEDEVMIIGGFDPNRIYDTVESVNIKTGKKRTLPPLQRARFGAVAAVVNGLVFVIGGVDSHGTTGSVEKWDPKTQKWSYSTSMLTPREGCGIGVLDNEIFVVGGWNKFTTIGDQGVKTVEAFCPFKEKWRTCGSLNEIRHWVSAGVAGNTLYAVGGRLLGDITYPRYKSIEVYNPSTDSWTFVADLNVARYGVACGSLNNKLVAVGGANTPTVEVYDEVLNKWNYLADCPTNRENSTLIQVPLSYLEHQITLN